MAGRDSLDLELVIERSGNPLHLLCGRYDEMKAAGDSLAPGHTLHGLRKTLGKMLAENGATTRQIMAILGHDDIIHAQPYTREAEQRRLASDGMRKLPDAKRPARS